MPEALLTPGGFKVNVMRPEVTAGPRKVFDGARIGRGLRDGWHTQKREQQKFPHVFSKLEVCR